MARWSCFPLLFLLFPALPAGAAAAPGSFQFGRFGVVPVVRPEGEPTQVVVLLSAGEGLGAKESEMAAILSHQGALVFEIDTVHYLQAADRGKNRCLFPAADFEGLSQFGQRTLGLASYRPPVLVGTGEGAALAYAALAQAPPNTFAGAVSAGFCEVLNSPRQLCAENGLKRDHDWKQPGQHLLPNPAVEEPWIILQSPTDAQCSAGPFGDFPKSVPNSQVIPLPVPPAAAAKSPAGDSGGWKGQLQQALASLAERSRQAAANAPNRNNELRDLALVEVAADAPEVNALAVVLSGSGGWTSLDRRVGNQLAARGVPVIGISSPSYFWKARNPEGTSQDLARILDHYLAAWHKDKAIIVGYSQGADVVPFMVDRLPDALRSRVALVGLIGPDASAQFRLHPDGWMSGRDPDPELPVAPEIDRLKGLRVLCVFGEKEEESLCPHLDPKLVNQFAVPSGHDFNGEAPAMADRFLAEAGLAPHGGASPAAPTPWQLLVPAPRIDGLRPPA